MPYTSHGHWYGDGDPTQPQPRFVAKCFGLSGCYDCRLDAGLPPLPVPAPAPTVSADRLTEIDRRLSVAGDALTEMDDYGLKPNAQWIDSLVKGQMAAKELRAEVERLQTWDGLMATLDTLYPADTFDGSTGDPGPRVVALTREVDRLKKQVEIVRRMGAEQTREAAYEAMDAERRSWESRRAVENVTLAELHAEIERLRNLRTSAWADVHALLSEHRDSAMTDNELADAVMALFATPAAKGAEK